jgi:DNA-binding NarL/FixJ family response regulator
MEIQICSLVAAGLSNKRMTPFLIKKNGKPLSERTVKIYLHRICRKLGVASKCELMFLSRIRNWSIHEVAAKEMLAEIEQRRRLN